MRLPCKSKPFPQSLAGAASPPLSVCLTHATRPTMVSVAVPEIMDCAPLRRAHAMCVGSCVKSMMGESVVLIAYLDEFGHVGPYVSRDHARHNTHPVFG